MVFLFVYGTLHHFVRIGFVGTRPLVYAVYVIDNPEELPSMPAMSYKPITVEQYEWLRNHLWCDVHFVPGGWPGTEGNLECREHGFQSIIGDGQVCNDLWEERQI